MSDFSLFINGSGSSLCFPIDNLGISTKDVYEMVAKEDNDAMSSFLSFQGKPIRKSPNLQLCDIIPFSSNMNCDSNTMVAPPPPPTSDSDSYGSTIQLQMNPTPLRGGKGGFGQALRSIGRAIARKKETNFEECRDLDGRRIRDVEHKKKIKDWENQKNELLALQRIEEEKKEEEEKKLMNEKIEEEKQNLQEKDSEIENAVMSALMNNSKKKKKKKKKKKRKKKKSKKKNESQVVDFASLVTPINPKKRSSEEEMDHEEVKIPQPDFSSGQPNNNVPKKKRTRKRKKKKKRKRDAAAEVEISKIGQEPPSKKQKL